MSNKFNTFIQAKVEKFLEANEFPLTSEAQSYFLESSLAPFTTELMELLEPAIMIDVDECILMEHVKPFLIALAGLQERNYPNDLKPLISDIRGCFLSIADLL